MKTNENSPYAITINNNPHISNSANVDVAQNIFFDYKNIIMEMQGNIMEAIENLETELPKEIYLDIKKNIENINDDLESTMSFKDTKEIIKSGKLNKLKYWLQSFADENSENRKLIKGAKYLAILISELLTKYNMLAEKLHITQIPSFFK